MRFNIDINLDNSAYENVGWELGENLEQVLSRIAQGVREGKVRDSNGNITGKWSIEND